MHDLEGIDDGAAAAADQQVGLHPSGFGKCRGDSVKTCMFGDAVKDGGATTAESAGEQADGTCLAAQGSRHGDEHTP